MSILNIANSGLTAFQNALSVTGNNIANIKTRGYSRQTLQFVQAPVQKYGSSYVGTGVSSGTLFRNADQFANLQVRNTQTVRSQFEIFNQQASQIDKLLSADGTKISTSLQTFFDTLGQLNNNPASSSSRDVALKQGQVLAQQFNFMQKTLDDYQASSTTQIKLATDQINQITSGLADLNEQLMGQPAAPQLLDARDDLLQQLAALIDITTIDQGDGTTTVATSSGQVLVVGTEQRTMTVSADNSKNMGTKVLLGNGAGQLDITNTIGSGMIGGLLNYEQDVLGKASLMIGQMAIGLAQKFNAQHQLGMDMNNQLGQNFFTDYNSAASQLNRSLASATNSGTGVLSVAISDSSLTQPSDYEFIVTNAAAGQVSAIRKSDGQTTALTFSNSPPAPPAGQVTLDGMTITVDDVSQLATNDYYTLTPARGAARDFAVQISDSSKIALASPVSTNNPLTNEGTGKIKLGTVLNNTAVNNQYRIDFLSPTQFNLVDVTNGTTTGPLPFVPNSDNTVQIPDSTNPSYSLVLSGEPKAGDVFTSEFNAGGGGDNANGLLLAAMQQAKIFSEGADTVFDRYSNLLSDIGNQTHLSQSRYEASDILFGIAVDTQQAVSGVNLDEEAANLLQFKKAYEAAGKVMQIASDMIDTLIQMTR